MSFKVFTQGLKDVGLGTGGTWVKADFHVHLPGSSDYQYGDADAYDRLAEALTSGDYAFAVVVKHEAFPTRQEILELQDRCPNTKIIPGAEINVIVDALFKKIGKDYFCHCIVAVDPEQDGDYGYVLRKAREDLSYRDGEYPAGFRSSVLDVGRFFRREGAIFIPAHLHQSKPPENSRSVDDLYDDDAFLGFIRDGAFDALEVRQTATARFFDGKQTTKEGLTIPPAVCVASSDAHHHDHILERQRFTWVRVEERRFSELVAALSFPHRVMLEAPTLNHARVVGLHIKGAFIPECWISLNEGLNALIGAKGSGKTAVLECLRFVLNTPVPSDRLESVKRHVAHVLGSSGYVECLVEFEGGGQCLISRRSDSPDRISVLREGGASQTTAASEGMPFPVSILGWHEIEAVADQPDARITLLDRVGDPRAIRILYDGIRQDVEQARDALPSLQRQIKRLDSLLHELWDLQKKRQALTRLKEGDILDLQRQYEWFLQTEQKIEGLRNDVASRAVSLEQAVQSRLHTELPDAPDPDAIAMAATALTAIVAKLDDNRKLEQESIADLGKSLLDVEGAANESATLVQKAFAAFREETYTPRVNALPPEDREILTKQIQVLEETKRLGLVEKQCEELLADVTAMAQQLRSVCQRICDKRDSVAKRRDDLVTALNSELDSVQVRFLRSANHGARSRFQNRYPGEGVDFIGYLQNFGMPEAYQNLVALFDSLSTLRMDESQWQIDKTLWDVRFVDLLDVADDDDIEISLLVGRAGHVPLQRLSAGQRCVAVFPLLLRNTRGPLVIDQPEDNLDNRYIADSIAPDLLRRKRHQQFLVTSHNANLVVLTDADLIIHVDSDGAMCSFPADGFLSCTTSAVRQSVLDVLDGGEAALTARQHKYGVS